MDENSKSASEIETAREAVIEGIMRDRMSRAIEGNPQSSAELVITMRAVMSDLASRIEIMSLEGSKPTEIWPAARTVLTIHEWLKSVAPEGDSKVSRAKPISKRDLARAAAAIREARGSYEDD